MKEPFPKGKEEHLYIILEEQLAIDAIVVWILISYSILVIDSQAASYNFDYSEYDCDHAF